MHTYPATTRRACFQVKIPFSPTHLPSLPTPLLSRPALFSKLNMVSNCTVVVAPAGMGKTVLLSDWVQHQPYLVAWCTLTDADNAPDIFWNTLLDAVRSGVAQTDSPDLYPMLSAQAAIDHLMVLLGQIAPLVLILDSYQVIDHPAIQLALADLFDFLSDRVRFVIASRILPHILLANIATSKNVVHIGADELLCTQDEAQAYLYSALQPHIDQAIADLLVKSVGGQFIALARLVNLLQSNPLSSVLQPSMLYRQKNAHYVDNTTRALLYGDIFLTSDLPMPNLFSNCLDNLLDLTEQLDVQQSTVSLQPVHIARQVWAILRYRRFDGAYELLEAAIQWYDQKLKLHDQYSYECTDEYNALFTALRVFIAHMKGDSLPSIQPLSKHTIWKRWQRQTLLLYSQAVWLCGAIAPARTLLAYILAKQSYEDEDISEHILIRTFLAFIEQQAGHIRQADVSYQLLLAEVLSDSQPIPSTLGYAALGRASIAYARNELADAKAWARMALALASQGEHIDGFFEGQVVYAWACLAQDDIPTATTMMGAAAHIALVSSIPGLYLRAQSYQALLALRQGNIATALHWAQTCGICAADCIDASQEQIALIWARVQIAAGYAAHTIGMLQHIHRSAAEDGRAERAYEAQVLHALALLACGEFDVALDLLIEPLIWAERHYIVRLFIDEGEPLARLLHKVKVDAYLMPFVALLLKTISLSSSRAKSQDQLLDTEPMLTPRQMDVLRSIAAGQSAKEISRNLDLALSTVKWYCQEIYQRLGVRSRTQAVARARQLGFLS